MPICFACDGADVLAAKTSAAQTDFRCHPGSSDPEQAMHTHDSDQEGHGDIVSRASVGVSVMVHAKQDHAQRRFLAAPVIGGPLYALCVPFRQLIHGTSGRGRYSRLSILYISLCRQCKSMCTHAISRRTLEARRVCRLNTVLITLFLSSLTT